MRVEALSIELRKIETPANPWTCCASPLSTYDKVRLVHPFAWTVIAEIHHHARSGGAERKVVA